MKILNFHFFFSISTIYTACLWFGACYKHTGVSTFTHCMKLKLTTDTPLESRDLGTIYRLEIKNGPDFLSEVLNILLNSNFVRYFVATIQLHQWRHHCVYKTSVQFTDLIQNKHQILHLKFSMHYWLQTLSDMLGWQKNYIKDDIMVATWPEYNTPVS